MFECWFLNFTDVSAHGSKLGQNIRWTWNSLESYTLWRDRRPARYSCMNWLEISIDMVFKSLKMLLLTLLRQRNTLKSIYMKNYTQTFYFRQIIVYHGTIYVPQTGDYAYVIQIPFSIALRHGNWTWCYKMALHWRHNDHDGVSNHQPHDCLPNGLFRHKSKKTSKLRVTGLCVGNSPGPVNSPHKGPVTRKMFPFDDVIMVWHQSWEEQECWEMKMINFDNCGRYLVCLGNNNINPTKYVWFVRIWYCNAVRETHYPNLTEHGAIL